MAIELTDQQRAAVDRRDVSLLVRAGAGTGKTSVLVERFVRAVVDDGVAVDAVLAITFTEKAAAQLGRRVRERFIELGRRDLAREAERAWISTIHGFCSRVLRAHALSAGIDPDFHVLDDLESERVALDAMDRALEAFLGEADPRRLEMVASYSPDKLREMVRAAHSLLRSRGRRRPSLEPVEEPRPAGERERLEAAARAALAELGACAEPGKQVLDAMKALEGCGGVLAAGAEGGAEHKALDALRLKGSATALKGDACLAFEEARVAYADLCRRRRHWRDHTLLRELLALFDEHYERLKRERSGLDFEDLQLCARDLFDQHAAVRDSYAGRFAHVLVDEFQDTNPLQNQILELLERDNLFRVGDENQSIYGFRNADVGVFREHHERAHAEGRAQSVTVNFRSRGEVLDAIDLAFGRVWGAEFEPLIEREGSRRPRPRTSPSVELLVTDASKGRWDAHFGELGEPFGPGMRSITPWRACEARLLARRVEELLADGWSHSDVVLLLRATTHMSVYERALEERGIPTHVVGGRGYWSQQQVGDLRHWLAALANPLDELAVLSLMASPLVGASLDSLGIVRLHARRRGRDVWWALTEAFEDGDGCDGLAGALPAGDRHRVERFVRLFAQERQEAPTVSLETLIDRAVTRTGYDRRVLAMPAGDRRMANVRKLMRMAREYEADEGRDLRGFIDFVAERDLIQEREGQAPLEAEELDAVRLMTVHRAKGLEFPVVCVADLGKSGREDYGALRISDDGRTGLRLADMGGGSVKSAEMEEIEARQKLADEAEERRIFYVAVTRAEQHLVLSGATDLEKRPEPRPLGEPMAWVWRSFCPGLPDQGAAGVHVDSYEGREVSVRWERCAPDTVEELLPAADRAPVRPEPAPDGSDPTPPLLLGSVPAPRALPVSRLSYSGLEAYRRCGYRFYLERALRLPGGRTLVLGDGERPAVDDTLHLGAGPQVGAEAAEPRAGDELPALLRGTVVHELLERLDFRRPVAPTERQVQAAIERHGAAALPPDVADVRALVEGFVRSQLCARLGRARRVRTELPFAFTLAPGEAAGRSLLMNGVVDVHAAEQDGVLIVDYKSDRLDGAAPAELCADKYGVQRLVYALAALRSGAERVEVTYAFLERPDAPVLDAYGPADRERLEAELLGLARGVVEARFEPTEEPHAGLCADCPGQPALCSWGPERTLATR